MEHLASDLEPSGADFLGLVCQGEGEVEVSQFHYRDGAPDNNIGSRPPGFEGEI